MKLKSLAYALLGCGSLAVLPQAHAQFADVVLLVDESGSMAGEHAWIDGMVASLNSSLVAAGVGAGADKNAFALVGFGNGLAGNLGRLATNLTSDLSVGGTWDLATNTLTTGGSFEDGYSAIDFAASNVSLRLGSKRNFILITDEDRDNGNGALSAATTSALLKRLGALLNVVVDQTINPNALGSNGTTSYYANGSGGFTTGAFGSWGGAYGTTKADYVDVAVGSGGAAWDLKILRNGGNDATSFTNAFVDLKVGEIIKQDPGGAVPEPSTYGMIGAGALVALIALRRRARA